MKFIEFLKFVHKICCKHPDDFRIIMCIYVAVSIITSVQLSHTVFQQIGTFLLEMAVCIFIGLCGLFSIYVVLFNSKQN